MNTAGRPEIPRASSWPDAEKLKKERELVGMYLSAHPLDPYYMELNFGTTCTIQNIEDIPHEAGTTFTFGGMVTDYQTRLSRNGNQFAILKLEDYTGSHELRLFGKSMFEYGRYGIPGTPIIVTCAYEKRRFGEEIDCNVVNIRLLDDVKGMLIDGITIKATPEEMSEQLATLLKELNQSSKENLGNLNFNIYDPKIKRSISLTSSVKVPITRKLVNILDSLEIEYKIQTKQ